MKNKEINVKVAEFMLKEIAEIVKHYKTDLIRDVEILTERENEMPVYWLPRECGTNIISFNHWESKSNQEKKVYINGAIDLIEHYQEQVGEDRWYKITDIYSDEADIKAMKYCKVILELQKMKKNL